MKKYGFISMVVLMLVLAFTLPAFATQPEKVEGYVPLESYVPGEVYSEYDVCDPVLVGHVVQPRTEPGLVIHGTFTAGNSTHCPYTTDLSGTCDITLIPVEIFGDPDSKPGRGIAGNCTGDLYGLHGRYLIDEWFGYVAWYHFDP